MAEALVFDFHRGTTHDGPGMRTTVFLKGCPLRCRWCHNPEGVSPRRELLWDAGKCIGCGRCEEACPNGAVSRTDGGVVIDRARCRECFSCAGRCPSRALHVAGRAWDIPSLVREACRDRMFFDEFGGGVTVSGGEPASQPAVLPEFLERLKAEGVQTALDTCGFAPWDVYEAVFPYVDVFLYDVKLLDPALHRRFTGADNALILENLRKLAGKLRGAPGKRLWIRTPLIPGATAAPENIEAIGAWLRENAGDAVERWELCAFNNVCASKYRELRREWPYAGVPLMGEGEVRALAAAAERHMRGKTAVSGLTRKPDEEKESGND